MAQIGLINGPFYSIFYVRKPHPGSGLNMSVMLLQTCHLNMRLRTAQAFGGKPCRFLVPVM